MVFWDSSAIVSLLVADRHSEPARQALRADDHMIVWWGTQVECLSALARTERHGVLSPSDSDGARRDLAILRERWDEVSPIEEVRDRAGELLLRHPLSAADAFQLAAAISWAGGRARGRPFHTYDSELGDAARREGFDLVPGR
jgi:predicted nucleic acid-binding protein